MKKIILILLITNCFINTFHAQTPSQRTCGTMQHHDYLKLTRPGYQTDLDNYNLMIEQYLATKQSGVARASSLPIVTVPVVVHVLYRVAGENISDAQAASQVQVLNDDFAKLNSDKIKVTQATFSTVASGANIRFCLAQRDPAGNPTTGVTHKTTTVTAFGTNDNVKHNSTGGEDAWDVTKYINIWVCNLGPTLLGYGEFPTASLSNTWGLVLHYKYTGSGGTAVAPYNLGRTGTHEFGHCFNLYHIWGDDGTACTGSDLCSDTPNQAGEHYGCFTAGSVQTDACTTTAPGVMWMNYMDYTDDACMYMFTAQQCARMEAIVNTAPWNILQTSLGCTPVNALDAGMTSVIIPSNGSSTCNTSLTPKITLSNIGTVTLTSATINFKMDATATQTVAWTGSLTTTASTIITLPTYTGLSVAAHTFSVWVSNPNAGVDANALNNSLSSTFTVTGMPVGAALPFLQDFETATFIPVGWTKITASTTNSVNTWSRVLNTTGVTAGSTACAKMDNYSGTIDITGQIDALRTPAITFVGANSSLNLKFDVSHKMYSTVDIDSLNVYISSDCGTTWTQLYTKGGTALSTSVGTYSAAAYTPTSNTQWRRETVSLSSYAGLPSVYLKFESRSGWGNNVFLDNINVSYIAAIPTSSFTSTSPKCVNSPISFNDASGNAPTSWNWVFAGGTPSVATTPSVSVTYTAPGSYTISHTATNATGTSTTYTESIIVNALPTLIITTPTICVGGTAILMASGANTYTWSAGQNTASISVTPSVTSVYSVFGQSSLGCVNSNSTTVFVNPLPIISINTPTICIGNTTTLTATGANTYTWSSGAFTTSVSVTPTVTTNYSVTGTNTFGCVNTKTTSITVNPLPNIAATSATICTGSTGTLTASGANTYTWSTTAVGSNLLVNPTVNTNYTVTGTSSLGCIKSTTTNVVISTAAVISVNSPTVCVGSMVNLLASGVNTYTWSTGANTSSIVVTPTISTTYTVTGILTGCSGVATKTTNVVVNPLPNITINSPTICLGQSAVLNAIGASTYTWSTGATTPSISVSPSGTTTFSVAGTDMLGCSNAKTTSVIINPLPNVTATTATYCVGSSAILTANGASTYTWSSGISSPTVAVSPTVTSSYSVTGTSIAGCVKTITTSVVVYPLPNLSVNSATICAGATANLSASGATTYTWSTGAVTTNVNVSPFATTVYTVSGSSLSCTTIVTRTVAVNVNPLPIVTLATLPGQLCTTSPAFNLSGSPLGGNYIGVGVVGSTFNPAVSGAGTFTVTYNYTNTNGCSNSASRVITINLCSGIDELENSELSIYPNPANDLIYVSLSDKLTNNATIELYDAIGKLVISEKVTAKTTALYINNLAKGIYTIRITSNQSQSISRIIKE